MNQYQASNFYQKVAACLLGVLIIVVFSFSFSSDALASSRTSAGHLQKIDANRYNRNYPTYLYESAIDTLSNRCLATPSHIADMSAVSTKNLLDGGKRFDNLSFLKQALDVTEGGDFRSAGVSCEEVFAMLTVIIQGGF